jgi:hypothetical protein
MAGTLRALRRRLLTPNESAALLANRGFHEKDPATRELLESIGKIFLTGYGCVMEARTPAAAEPRLERIPEQFRGFGYEGAAMACAMLDGLTPGRRSRVAEFLDLSGRQHSYMIHVGIGWAMARLPGPRRRAVAPADPLLRWLALDGYGFHQAYFHTDEYVYRHRRDAMLPWPGGECGRYAARAVDQGVGRAVWFAAGADPALATDLVERFPADRRPDLYSGLGLAATYAGGADERELKDLWERVADHRPQFAQGAAFGATARAEAGLTGPHTEAATRLFCGMEPDGAMRLCARSRPAPVIDRKLPGYDTWRTTIATALTDDGPPGARRADGGRA